MEMTQIKRITDFTWSTQEGILIPVSATQRRQGSAFELFTGETTLLIKAGPVAEKMRKLEGSEVKITGMLRKHEGHGPQMTPIFYRLISDTERWDSVLPAGIFPVEKGFALSKPAV